MPLNEAQLIAADRAYWTSLPWNGTDAPGTGTALGADYALYRNCGARSSGNVYQFNGNTPSMPTVYDVNGWYGAANQAFAASSTKHDGSGNPLPWDPQYQRPAGQRLLAAILYGNPVIPAGDVHAGKYLADSALIALCAPLSLQNVTYSPTGVPSIVPSTDPNRRGFPSLLNLASINPTHSVTFWLAEFLHALLLLQKSPIGGQGSPTYNQTYGDFAASLLPQLADICRWMLFGGTASYACPPAANGDGSFTGGLRQSIDDAADAALTHRRWFEALTYALMSVLNGQTDSDFGYFAKHYAGIAIGLQSPLGYFPEDASHDGLGADVNYNGASLKAGKLCYVVWPDSDQAYRDGTLLPAVELCAQWQASRVVTTASLDAYGNPAPAGANNVSFDTRTNPVIGPPGSAFAGILTGFPVVPLAGGAFQYAGEYAEFSTQPKIPDTKTIFEALSETGYLMQVASGADGLALQPLAILVAQANAWAAMAVPAPPVAPAAPSAITASAPPRPAYTGYPSGADVQGFLGALGLTLPPGLDYEGAAAAASSEFEQRTGWQPFLAGPQFPRYFDPPGFGPSAGRGSASRGGKTLELSGGLLDLPDAGVLIGYVPNTLSQAGAGQIGNALTAASGSPGTVLTRGLNYFLKPDNAPARGLAWTSIDFLSPARGLPQSIVVTGVWGRVRSVPADVFRAIVQKAAAEIAPQIGLSVSEGTYRRRIGDSDKTFGGTGAPAPLAYEAQAWETQFTKTVQRWKRVTV